MENGRKRMGAAAPLHRTHQVWLEAEAVLEGLLQMILLTRLKLGQRWREFVPRMGLCMLRSLRAFFLLSSLPILISGSISVIGI